MTTPEASIASSSAADWLVAALRPPGDDRHYVDELLPPGYRRYLRVLDPWHPAQLPSPRERWRDLAVQAGVDFYPEISWHELEASARPAGADHRTFLYCGGDPSTRQRVVDLLATAGAGPFFFRYDLAAVVALGRDAPFVVTCDELSLEAVRAAAASSSEQPHPLPEDPERWWPQDRSWVVNRDFDLDEVYLACNDLLADRFFADAELEVVEVSPSSRVDWRVDEARRNPVRPDA